MPKNNTKKTNNKYLKKQIILFFIIFIYLLSISFTFGRYALKTVKSYLSGSKEFCFYSDKLGEKEIEYPINWSGTEQCIIPINLYTKINSLKKLTHDVKYKVTYELLSSNATCTLSKQEGIVPAETNTDSFTVTITPNSAIEENEKMSVKVNVITIDDFEKILTANFVISINNEEVSYKIDDSEGRAYFNLIINNMQKQDVTIGFDSNQVFIDTTNNIFKNIISYEFMEGTKYINKVNFIAEAMSNINIRFYKRNKMEDYTNNENIINFEYKDI